MHVQRELIHPGVAPQIGVGMAQGLKPTLRHAKIPDGAGGLQQFHLHFFSLRSHVA